jgi:hypothetical protein
VEAAEAVAGNFSHSGPDPVVFQLAALGFHLPLFFPSSESLIMRSQSATRMAGGLADAFGAGSDFGCFVSFFGESLMSDDSIKNAEDGVKYLQSAFEDVLSTRRAFNTRTQIVLASVSGVVALVTPRVKLPHNAALILLVLGLLGYVGVFLISVYIWKPYKSSYPGKSEDKNEFWASYVCPPRITALAHRLQDLSLSIKEERNECRKISNSFRNLLCSGTGCVALTIAAYILSHWHLPVLK